MINRKEEWKKILPVLKCIFLFMRGETSKDVTCITKAPCSESPYSVYTDRNRHHLVPWIVEPTTRLTSLYPCTKWPGPVGRLFQLCRVDAKAVRVSRRRAGLWKTCSSRQERRGAIILGRRQLLACNIWRWFCGTQTRLQASLMGESYCWYSIHVLISSLYEIDRKIICLQALDGSPYCYCKSPHTI